jgi:hypothetical protein
MGLKIINAVVDNHGGTFMRVRGEHDIEIDGLEIRNYTVGNFREMKTMLRNLFISSILIFIFLSNSSNTLGQTVSSYNNCENNLALLDSIRPLIEKDNPFIVIAYRGKKENSNKYSLRRLNTIKTVLGDKNIVFAIGEKLVTKPKVEIYVDGKLNLVFETNSREKLKVQLCGLLY